MAHPRDILNEIKWRDGLNLSEIVIYYKDRVMPERGYIKGIQIKKWDKSFIYTKSDSVIPFHRVDEIIHKDKIMFKRKKKER
jgi:uncharacterized protein (UPF0248 family)